jgi:hypothetical protein
MTGKKQKRAKRPGPGQPPFEPTADQRRNVEALIGYGLREEDICRLIMSPRTGKPIDAKTLRKHFREEISTGQVKVKAKIVQTLYKQHQDGNVTAGIFLAKNLLGWRSEPKDGGADDKELTVVVKGGLPTKSKKGKK